MRTVLAIAAVLALATGAEAFCPPVPDTAATGYVLNNLNRTLCLQNELRQATDALANKALVDQQIQQLQRDMIQQRLELQQLQAGGLPADLLPKL